jgi:hypothetical protein
VDGEKRIEHIEYLPIMNMRNQSIPLASVTSFDVNKSIQRSLVKACARHGLGLYIFAGEDLPEDEPAPPPAKRSAASEAQRTPEAQKLFEKVDEAIKRRTAKMTPEEKKKFAADLKMVCGVVNYKAIEDEAKLRLLYDKYVKE